MAKQHPRDFAFSQWFLIAAPSVAGTAVAFLSRKDMEFPMPLYFVGASLALSLLLLFLMVYGEDL